MAKVIQEVQETAFKSYNSCREHSRNLETSWSSIIRTLAMSAKTRAQSQTTEDIVSYCDVLDWMIAFAASKEADVEGDLPLLLTLPPKGTITLGRCQRQKFFLSLAFKTAASIPDANANASEGEMRNSALI